MELKQLHQKMENLMEAEEKLNLAKDWLFGWKKKKKMNCKLFLLFIFVL